MARSYEHLEGHELTSERKVLTGALVGFAATAVIAAVDVAADLREGTTTLHVIVEGLVILIGLVGASALARRLAHELRSAREAHLNAQRLARELEASKIEAEHWRGEARDLLRGLGAALDRQFERWALSRAEKEVALLLLKGLSHKEIAEVRSITEATARQQARAVYKKADLSGRNDLAAFFLEDLLLPSDASEPR